MTNSAAATPIRSAFSLIEVLLATAILLVALLGVAAVFPRVLLTQQDAARTAGSLAQEGQGRAALLARDSTGPQFWADWANQPAAGDITSGGGVTMPPNTNRTADNPTTGSAQLPADGSWYIPFVSSVPGTLFSGSRLNSSLQVPAGALLLGTILQGSQARFNGAAQVYDRDLRVVIPLRERLRLDNPDSAFTTGSVWDIAVRRVVPRDFRGATTPQEAGGNLPVDARVQVAMFVRPLDPRLAIVPGESANAVRTIREALYSRFDSLPAAQRRLPISSFSDAAGGTGPSLDGRFEDRVYSNLLRATVITAASSTNNTNQLLQVGAIYGPELLGGGASLTTNKPIFDGLIRLMRTPGQLLVDASGNIHEVAAYRPGDPEDSVRLTRPIVNGFLVGEIVFSPQKPSRVNVFVVSPAGE